MTTNNPVCASDAHMEMYSSKLYTSALFLNLIIATTSMILTGFAIQKLFMESIINISTRMFLFCGLMCCSLHQTAYIVLRLSEPCNLYYPAIDCKYVTFSLVAGNTGMIFIQSAMTIDRIFATIFPKLWPKLKYWPGVVLSILMIACNYANVQIIFWGDPLTEYVPTCGQFPSKSVNRFQTFLAIALYMSIAHMVINVIILYINVLQDRQQRLVSTSTESKSFNVNQRYQSREALKSSQAIFFLSMSQFFACLIYSVFTKVFLEFQLNLSPLQSGLVLALSYTTPYACIAIPSLIIFTFRFIKNQRLRNINELRSQTETGDECMRKIAKIWEK